MEASLNSLTSFIRSIVAGALVSTALLAQSEPTPTPTLEDLQRQIDELRKLQTKQPVLGGPFASMKVFGRIHLDAWEFADTDPAINAFDDGDPTTDPGDNFQFRRARLGVSGKIQEGMTYKIEIDFGKPDSFTFKDVYFGWTDLPVVRTLLIGNQKRPYGLDHLNSSRYNVFIERPFVIEANNQDARRLGISSYGLSEDKAWNWRYGLFEQTDFSGSGLIRTDTFQPEIAGRIAHTLYYEDDGRNYAHGAVAGSIGFPNGDPGPGDISNQARYRTRPEARSVGRWINTGRISDANTTYLVAAEAVYNQGPLQAVAEYQHVFVDRGNNLENPQFGGGYVYVAYFLTGEHMPWSRKSGTLGRPVPDDTSRYGAWQLAARYSFADYSDAGVLGGRADSLTVGLNWYWNRHASMQFNYIHGRVDDRAVTVGSETFDGGDYDIFGVRFRVDF